MKAFYASKNIKMIVNLLLTLYSEWYKAQILLIQCLVTYKGTTAVTVTLLILPFQPFVSY